MSAQAKAASAEWLAYAPAPATPAGVCIVDTGVDLNADVAATVARRAAVDGGGGGDTDASVHHGTLMSMVVAAQPNGTGMVGVAPSATRIVSIRASTGDGAAIRYYDFKRALLQCSKYIDTDAVRTVLLALGSTDVPSPTEQDELADRVAAAHDAGLNVVAAAGNSGGAVEDPASAPGVFAVGAGSRDGGLCPFSARGLGLDLQAPGCDLDTADPVTLTENSTQGTSQASAFVAGVVSALRAYSPSMSWSTAESLLLQTSTSGRLNVEAAFRAAGLGAVVDAGKAATPGAPTAAPSTAPAPSAAPTLSGSTSAPAAPSSTGGANPDRIAQVRRWARPSLRSVWWRRGVLSVVLRRVPREAAVRLTLQRRVRGRWRTVRRATSPRRVIRVRSSRRPMRVKIQFADRAGLERDSLVRSTSRIRR